MPLKCLPETVKAVSMLVLDSTPLLPLPAGAGPATLQWGPAWYLLTQFSRTGCAICVDILCSSSFPYSSVWLLPPFLTLSVPAPLGLWSL